MLHPAVQNQRNSNSKKNTNNSKIKLLLKSSPMESSLWSIKEAIAQFRNKKTVNLKVNKN